MRELVIVGGGGHGRETLDIVEAINAVEPTWAFAGFRRRRRDHCRPARPQRCVAARHDRDPRPHRTRTMSSVLAHLRSEQSSMSNSPPGAALAATLIHPAATVASDNRIGDGVLLAAGARVTTNVTLGRHVHLNVNAVVSHDCVVGDYTTLSPGSLVNGDVQIGTGVFLGTGAIITPGVTVGDHAVIGAGAVVVQRRAIGCDC